MKIENVQRPPYEVEDWEFFFLTAPEDPFGVVLDLEAGDKCELQFGAGHAVIQLVEKKSYVGLEPQPAETIYVPLTGTIVKTRRRIVEAPPLEVVEEWQRLLEELGTENPN